MAVRIVNTKTRCVVTWSLRGGEVRAGRNGESGSNSNGSTVEHDHLATHNYLNPHEPDSPHTLP